MTSTFLSFTPADLAAIAPELTLAAAGGVIVLLEAFAPRLRSWFATISVAAIAASLYYLLRAPEGAFFDGRLETSPLTTVVGLLLGASALVALLVAGPYLVKTGEEKGESGITPKMNFLDGQRGRGAWELAFRYENLQMHDSARANRAEAFTMGVNWWLTKFVRYQSNIMLERFKDPLRTPTPGDQDHLGYLSRIQVIF